MRLFAELIGLTAAASHDGDSSVFLVDERVAGPLRLLLPVEFGGTNGAGTPRWSEEWLDLGKDVPEGT